MENKIHNLKLVGEKVNNLIIKPNEVFSFWKLIGKPNDKNGFKKGRNLIDGKVSDDFGGGICQFSSILYHLALQTGFKIIERHAHSLDIYEEHERFTPLGAYATVVFGYKDLQFQNIYDFPIQFKSEISEDEIKLSAFSEDKIHINEVKFDYHIVENGVEVQTLVDDELLFKNYYKRL
ncbi:VanW family protein [Frigoriflavimonas asaccharolytica]|uniref:Vancomycin resistance protein VanW n=1 Tax=Frigoriflavimonas asaccharolytica TaxID=2735899 RepID=A0A8J8GBZ3_9FLAO|nr:VanW family protein [Frigoriflavimonas asaccharolytica]NRS93732.1 vancomycin resistance protein VanW [Frigoriflavimonas asaccharolytica]